MVYESEFWVGDATKLPPFLAKHSTSTSLLKVKVTTNLGTTLVTEIGSFNDLVVSQKTIADFKDMVQKQHNAKFPNECPLECTEACVHDKVQPDDALLASVFTDFDASAFVTLEIDESLLEHVQAQNKASAQNRKQWRAFRGKGKRKPPQGHSPSPSARQHPANGGRTQAYASWCDQPGQEGLAVRQGSSDNFDAQLWHVERHR